MTEAQTLPTKRERNLGIDLFRILAMFMIVILHTLGKTNILDGAVPGTASYYAIWFLEISAICAVNCYGIISGYVGRKSKFKPKNIVTLWLEVVLYGLLFVAVNCIVTKSAPTYNQIFYNIFPVMHYRYWYFTAYFALFFFMPLLNNAVENLSKKVMTVSLIAVVSLFSVLSTVFKLGYLGDYIGDSLQLKNGYSILWLMALYLIGAYISKYDPFEKLLKKHRTLKCLTVYLLCVAFSWGTYVFKNHEEFRSYISPTVLLCAVALLELFKNAKISRCQKLIQIASASTFGVYVIHESDLGRNIFWGFDFYEKIAKLPTVLLIPAVIGVAVCVFVVCSVIDIGRGKLFDLLKIKQRLGKLEEKIMKE